MKRDGILADKASVKHVKARKATDDELLLVHSHQHLETMGMIQDAGAVGAARRRDAAGGGGDPDIAGECGNLIMVG